MIIGVPSDAEEAERSRSGAVYVQTDGAYKIMTKRFPARHLPEAVKSLTDSVLCSARKRQRFGMQEYILNWLDGGSRVKANVLLDGAWCYAVVFAAKSPEYDALATEVFSTFGLFYDEGA